MSSIPDPPMWKLLLEKVIPPLLVSCCLATAGGVMMIWNKLDRIETIDIRVAALEKDVIYLRSQAVTMETLKRIELALLTMSQVGKGNEAMGVVAKVIRNELDARKDKQ